jgi:colanic acid biosynthesis glycosyl transferase WcaI
MDADYQERKRIILVTQWFPPEHAPIGYMFKELADHLSSSGLDVEVVTGFPNHPTGRVQPPYRISWKKTERVLGFTVTRLWHLASESRTFFSRGLDFASFLARTLIYLCFCKKPAVLFCVLQPQILGLALSWVARLRGVKLAFTVQDLHTDVLIELSVVKSRWLVRALKGIERSAYRKSDGLAVISRGFEEHVRNHGASCPVWVIPNWIDLEAIYPDASAGRRFLDQHGLSSDRPVILYAGTLGYVSGAEIVIECARANPNWQWLIVGEGPIVPKLRELANDTPAIKFLPFQPRSSLNALQNCSTISIVSLAPGRGRHSVPSKVLGYMAAAKPVVACVDATSETAHLIQASGCGKLGSADDSKALSENIRLLLNDNALQKASGDAGRRYLLDRYSKQIICKRYEDLIVSLI